jgi:DNA recombination protein RmuC
VQLEALVRNVLPPQAFEMQAVLPNGTRADCVLKLPPPTGLIAVDSKFPLENFNRMFDSDAPAAERSAAQRQFKADVRRHVDDIAAKYIVAGVTADGAVMFLPAEAVFAEIHAYHRDLVDYAMSRRVWIVSPTTLMAVLNTARAVIKDVETRQQVGIIEQALIQLGKDFRRFDQRMAALARHISQAHDDAQDVQISSRKLTARFERLENADVSRMLAEDAGPVEDRGGG